MISIRNLRIRSKVVLVTMMTAGAALLLAGGALLWFEVSDFKERIEGDVASIGNVIAANSVAAVSFSDEDAATEMLVALRAEPKVLAARIYSESGSTLATYRRVGFNLSLAESPGADGFARSENRLTYFAPIQDSREQRRVGTIFLEANFDELRNRLTAFVKLLGLVLAASGFVALALSAALQRYIAGPIVQLASAMKLVSSERDYALRVPQISRDELGELVAGFNAMLGQIESRDEALERARESLEKRVEERTTELRLEVGERRRAERNLAHSLSLMIATLDSTADGILVVDRYGEIVSINRKFIEMWRIPEKLANAREDRELLAFAASQIKDPTTFVERVSKLYDDPTIETFDIIDFVDGRRFERYSLPHRVEGECVGRVWSFRDISERTAADARIHEQASLLDLAQDAIIVRDMEDMMLFWNKGAERLLGWPSKEAVGTKLDIVSRNDADRFAEAKRSVLALGEWAGELTHLDRDGREVRTESRWTLLRDSEGQPKAALTINTDVTERKKLEAQFLRAQRMESIGTLAGGIAHDLNNMLSPILVSVDLLRAQELGRDTDSLLELIENSAERGAGLVRQILHFARGAEGKRIPVALDRVIRDVWKIARDTFPKNIQIADFEPAPDLWMAKGDATLLHQVVLNLCVNARDAMPEGGTLRIEAENFQSRGCAADLRTAPAVGPHVVIRVTDTGTGIPADVRDKIFEPFFTTKDIGQGTGLGLSTSIAIIKGHEGLIDCESEVGRGTTFTVCLPAFPAGEQVDSVEVATLPTGESELILLVDDDESIRLVIKQTLEFFGYRVIAVADGFAAIETFRRSRHDISIVITDMMMPGMDGAATIRGLKEIDEGVRIIAASGLMSDARALAAAEAGAVAFLPKPYSAKVLLRTVRQLLPIREIRDSPADAAA